MSKLNQEEKEILQKFEAGEIKPSKNAADIQKRTLSEGMLYQTLVASILHKYVEVGCANNASNCHVVFKA